MMCEGRAECPPFAIEALGTHAKEGSSMNDHPGSKLSARLHHDRGASLVEYALLLALIAVVCIAAVTTLGSATSSSYSRSTSSMFTPN